jgi:hypothetical protein
MLIIACTSTLRQTRTSHAPRHLWAVLLVASAALAAGPADASFYQVLELPPDCSQKDVRHNMQQSTCRMRHASSARLTRVRGLPARTHPTATMCIPRGRYNICASRPHADRKQRQHGSTPCMLLKLVTTLHRLAVGSGESRAFQPFDAVVPIREKLRRIAPHSLAATRDEHACCNLAHFRSSRRTGGSRCYTTRIRTLIKTSTPSPRRARPARGLLPPSPQCIPPPSAKSELRAACAVAHLAPPLSHLALSFPPH